MPWLVIIVHLPFSCVKNQFTRHTQAGPFQLGCRKSARAQPHAGKTMMSIMMAGAILQEM
ncbi:MAG: hypothetical protein IJ985_07680 [Akkermansia sp.]|nr:hypothetical protein [Akkermansia sp.]